MDRNIDRNEREIDREESGRMNDAMASWYNCGRDAEANE